MHSLVQIIESVQRRLVWRARLAAICAVAAIVLAAATLLGGLDYVLRYTDPGLRIMATLAWTAVAAWAIYRWWSLLHPRASQLDAARKIESHFPQLHDSLASAVEFLQQSEDDETAGSTQLRRLVVTEAQLAVEDLPLEEVVDRRPVRMAATWLAVAAMPIALWFLIDATAARTALVRLAAPLAGPEWPRQHHLAFRNVPNRLAAGQTFEVELIDEAGPLPEDLRIEYRQRTSAGSRTSSALPIYAGDIALARRENVQHSFAFRAEGGDDDTMPWHRVEVVQLPKVESLQVVVHPPAYTGLPPTIAERHFEVLAGSSLEVRGTTSDPISSARVLLDGGQAIRADLTGETKEKSRHSFHVPPGRWVATETGPYRLELTDTDGLAIVVGQWNLRVKPDRPPSIAWQQPTNDLYVTPQAVVPIELAVNDDLAIARVELVFERAGTPNFDDQNNPTDSRVALYQAPEKPVPPKTAASTSNGETRNIDFVWNLAPLQLPVGAQLVCNGQAVDYRPATGHTVTPRRITIITAEELESRLAERQSRIVRQLEQALANQRAAREDVRRLEARGHNAAQLASADRNALDAVELRQRGIKTDLTDPLRGVSAAVDAVLSEIELNRLTSSDLRTPMVQLRDELSRLAGGPLSGAERELTSARKSADALAAAMDDAKGQDAAQAYAEQVERLSHSLSQAGDAQGEIIESLQKLVTELSGGVDYRQLALQLAQLREEQVAHAESTRSEIGYETLLLSLDELNRQQRAKLSAAAASQQAISRRLGAIQRAMDRLAEELAQRPSDEAQKLSEAANLLRQSAVVNDMQEVARHLMENRIGQALEREREIADELKQVLNVLQDRPASRTDQIAENLRAAEERLAALQQKLANLRRDVEQTESQPAAAGAERLAQQGAEQQQLQQNIEKLARELTRSQAPDAGQSAQNAANKLANRTDGEPAPQPPRPSPSGQVQAAERDLQQAAQQLADRRTQAEDELALEFVGRFQAELAEMVRRQQQVVDETVAIDSTRAAEKNLSDEQTAALSRLAREERELAATAQEHSELLFGLGAVRAGLEDANRRLAAAAEQLDKRSTGATAQRAERGALARLEGMLQAFAQTASEASPNNQNQGDSDSVSSGEQPQRRPTFELLEVKMLRMLQADLNERTRDLQTRLDAVSTPSSPEERLDLLREAQELQAEQGRLANLVQEMLSRDNEDEGN